MRAYRIEKTLSEDGALELEALPFHKGETVEVIVLERQSTSSPAPSNPVKGSVRRYNDPTEPVAFND